jgi:hypothetical protein
MSLNINRPKSMCMIGVVGGKKLGDAKPSREHSMTFSPTKRGFCHPTRNQSKTGNEYKP